MCTISRADGVSEDHCCKTTEEEGSVSIKIYFYFLTVTVQDHCVIF